MIVKKSPEQIEAMYRSGQILGEVITELRGAVMAGVTTKDLDEIAERSIRLRGGVPSFLGYRGFPASICVAPNEVVVHGIPDDRALKDGDIISLDFGLILDGWHSDSAVTVAVGDIDDESAKLLDVTRDSLDAGIEQCVSGNHLGDVSHAIQVVVESAGFSVVREYSGHGIGRSLHEDPQVPNYGMPGRGPKLEPGWVIAVEPMVNVGDWQTRLLDDGWAVVTTDGARSAHFEHTIAITEAGPRVLTAVER